MVRGAVDGAGWLRDLRKAEMGITMLRACDVLIIGAGPAGIQAAIHASRRGARVIVLGRLAKTRLGKAWVENLLCILGQVQRYELLLAGKKQAEAAGAVFIELDAVRLAKKDDSFERELEDGSKITCLAVILSTGITRERSPIRSEKKFIGRASPTVPTATGRSSGVGGSRSSDGRARRSHRRNRS